jgi:pyrophosphate--fructose-6-phosphate 1-phosphotransferase
MSLSQIVDYIADVVSRRAEQGKNYGVALIPEGIIEFIPEMKVMISNLNDTLAHSEDLMSCHNRKKFDFIEEKHGQRQFGSFQISSKANQIAAFDGQRPSRQCSGFKNRN